LWADEGVYCIAKEIQLIKPDPGPPTGGETGAICPGPHLARGPRWEASATLSKRSKCSNRTVTPMQQSGRYSMIIIATGINIEIALTFNFRGSNSQNFPVIRKVYRH